LSKTGNTPQIFLVLPAFSPESRLILILKSKHYITKLFFRAMEDETWIKGFFSERWDWFDQYKRPPEPSYYDQTAGSSPRNKPAEEIIKIWYNST